MNRLVIRVAALTACIVTAVVTAFAVTNGSPEAATILVALHSTPTEAFVDASGTPVRLYGLNMPPVWHGSPGQTYAQADYDKIAARGFNAVRFVLQWRDFEPTKGNFDATSLSTLDTAIGRAKAAGLYVILDEIQCYGSNGMDQFPAWAIEGTDNIASIQDNAGGYVAMLAGRYKNELAVAAYDLVSEPHVWPIDRTRVMRMYSLLMWSVRPADPSKIVVVEPTFGDSYLGGVDWNAQTRRDNVVLSIHDYYGGGAGDGYDHTTYGTNGNHTWSGGAGYVVPNLAELDAHVKATTDAATAAGLPVWIGEFGIDAGAANHDQWIKDTVSVFKKYGLGYSWWEYRSSNPNSATDASGNWFSWVDLFAPVTAPPPPPPTTTTPTTAPATTTVPTTTTVPATTTAPTTTAPPPPTTKTVMAVGDFTACQGSGCSSGDSKAVHDLIAAQNPDALIGLGDYQYDNISTIGNGWNVLYGPKPGGFYPITYPTAGPTHDVTSCTDTTYQNYFGRNAMLAYSFDLGSWHIISLPSAAWRFGCDTAGITTWLANDLNAHTNVCTLAFLHEPYWTRPTSSHSRTTAEKPWVQALYDHGADVLLQAHNHDYQRFAPQDPNDVRDDARGIRAFVVGTGGIGLYTFTGTVANVDASNDTTFGALKLTLGDGTYTWQFLRASGGTFIDGPATGSCH